MIVTGRRRPSLRSAAGISPADRDPATSTPLGASTTPICALAYQLLRPLIPRARSAPYLPPPIPRHAPRNRRCMCFSPDHPDSLGEPERERGLNLLLSVPPDGRGPSLDQLARLLEPFGITSMQAESGEEAERLIRHTRVHIAVIDWSTPLASRGNTDPAGERILQLLRRLAPTPPVVVIRPPQAAHRENVRGLTAALREGAFAVVDRPVHLETMLEVMRRIVQRHYHDHWPAA